MGATRTCPQCMAPAAEGSRFCASCGSPLEAARESRKVVTALFSDIVGSTTLGERFDPEDFRDIVSEAVSRAIAVCERYGGVIENVAGDGALALFGAPVAHEDDPERAILAGLGIVEAVGEWSVEVRERWQVESLDVRVGIETGIAVVGVHGQTIESGSMGDTLNTAARIQSEAEPGTVLVGARTRRLVDGLFEWGSSREVSLKGKSLPVSVSEALRRRSAPEPLQRRAAQAPIVGREGEMELAREVVREAVSGVGRVLLISGEAGVGKTRLLAEIHGMFDEATGDAGRTGLWLVGRCASYGEALPYWPIQGLIRDWLGASGEAPADEASLRRSLSPVLGQDERGVAPRIASLLGIGSSSGGSDPGGASQERARRRVHDAFATLLDGLCSQAPVAVSLEDAHWADASSADLLEHLAETISGMPLLLVVTGRQEEGVLDGLASVAREAGGPRPAEIRLTALPESDERRLLAELVGTDSLPESLERGILERAEGNPLYLEELALSLIDTGAVVREDGGWRFDPGVPIELPDTLEKIVSARIDRLPDHCHSVLGAAAVLGRRFDVDLLERVSGTDPRPELPELERLDLIRPEGPAGSYRFKHFVVREAAYNTLLRSDRKRLHAQAAEALQTGGRGAGQSDLGLIASHYRSAGELERALDFRARAAEAAASIPAYSEALAHAEDGLAVAEELGLGAESPRFRRLLACRGESRFAMGAIDEARLDLEEHLGAARRAGNLQEQMSALLRLAGTTRFGGDWDEAERRSSEALEIAEGLGDTSTQASLLRQLSILSSNRLRFDRALEFGHRAKRLAESSGSTADMAAALDALKLAALFVGDLEMLDRTARPLIEFHREHEDFSMPRHWALVEWAHIPLIQGRFDEASEHLELAGEDARQADIEMFEPIFLATRCWLERSRGNLADAVAHGRDGAEVAARLGAGEWEAWARANLGWAYLDAGRARPAAAELRAGLKQAERSGALAQLIRCAALLADAGLRLGDEDEARGLASLAEELLEGVSVPPGGAWLWGGHATIAVGRVRTATGEPDRARSLISPLAEAASREGWLELASDAQVVLGKAALAEGHEAEARDLLEGAIAVAAPFPTVLARAREALAGLSRIGG